MSLTPYVQDADFALYVGDVRDVLAELPDGSVDCVVTSPPYWGLRDYGTEGQLGLEATPDAYVANMVAVFREVRRVLAAHGTCWVNLGDSYAATVTSDRHFTQPTGPDGTPATKHPPQFGGQRTAVGGLKPKDLVGIPWRVAFALQADGWYLRADIIWSKNNPMPESVTDRPTKAHEYVFLLSKQPRYFFDQEAVREPHSDRALRDVGRAHVSEHVIAKHYSDDGDMHGRYGTDVYRATLAKNGGVAGHPAGRNVRSVWEIATQPYAEAHFATYPEELVRRCILAGCPELVCGTCGKPRERITETTYEPNKNGGKRGRVSDGHDPRGHHNQGVGDRATRIDTTVGWSDCGCVIYCPTGFACTGCRYCETAREQGKWRRGTVLDPFMGSGTTALVARRYGRHSVGIELNEAYAAMCATRLQQLSLLAEGTA